MISNIKNKAAAVMFRTLITYKELSEKIEQADKIIKEKYPNAMTVSELCDDLAKELETYPKYIYGYYILLMAYIKEITGDCKYLINKNEHVYLSYHRRFLGKYMFNEMGVNTDNENLMSVVGTMLYEETYEPKFLKRHIDHLIRLDIEREYGSEFYENSKGISFLFLYNDIRSFHHFRQVASTIEDLSPIILIKDILEEIGDERIKIMVDIESKTVTIKLKNIYDDEKDISMIIFKRIGYAGINYVKNMEVNKDWITRQIKRELKYHERKFIKFAEYVMMMGKLEKEVLDYYKDEFSKHTYEANKIDDRFANYSSIECLAKCKNEGISPEVVMKLMLSGRSEFKDPQSIILKLDI